MKIFIGWSGIKSRVVAQALRDELPAMLHEVDVFVSSEDIAKGSAWFQTIASEIENSAFSIVCLTAENLSSNWIHFESGALAAKFSQTKVAPLLIGLESSQVPPPLSQLQLTQLNREDFYKLMESINKHLKKPLGADTLRKSFDRSWPELERKTNEELSKLKAVSASASKVRTDREILEEILGIVRSGQSVIVSKAFEDRLASFLPPISLTSGVGAIRPSLIDPWSITPPEAIAPFRVTAKPNGTITPPLADGPSAGGGQ